MRSAGYERSVGAVAIAHAALAEADAAVATQRAVIAEAAAREDYARHVVEELSALAPVPAKKRRWPSGGSS